MRADDRIYSLACGSNPFEQFWGFESDTDQWGGDQMKRIEISIQDAREFLLRKHGLMGEKRYEGKTGVMELVGKLGCIQYDPIDVCGKNADLVLQSRIRNYKKSLLNELLYTDRLLLDHFDKNLSIYAMEDFPKFSRVMNEFRAYNMKHHVINGIKDEVLKLVKEKGAVSSSDLPFAGSILWDWGKSAKLAKAALEALYVQGDLLIHHKVQARKFYSVFDEIVPQALLGTGDGFSSEIEYTQWRVLRRIESVGMLQNRPSDALLMIRNLKSKERVALFDEMVKGGLIVPVNIQGIKEVFYVSALDLDGLLARSDEEVGKRCEFLAPLDNLLWDRKIISSVFGFDYKWEIYTPREKRKYGYYVLPVLYGTSFLGRIEMVQDKRKGVLHLKNLWLEQGVDFTEAAETAIEEALSRFCDFLECTEITDERAGKFLRI